MILNDLDKLILLLRALGENTQFCLFGLKANLVDLVNLSAGTAQKNLLLRDTRAFKILMPVEISKQKEIAFRISKFQLATQRLEAIYQKKLANLFEIKQSLLQKAFAGELTAEPETAIKEEAAA